MDRDVLVALVNNAALLMVLSVIYEAVYYLPSKYRSAQPWISGVLVAAICVGVMSVPLRLWSGIIFDTRTILISATALMLGPIPAAVTMAAAVVFRVFLGGVGVLAGIATIVTSALMGLAWRRWLFPKASKWQWLSIYAMSVCVHAAMLACQMLLPRPDSVVIIRAIALPVMLVFPVATVLLCLLLLRQQALRHTRQQLEESEERFKMLFDKAPLGYQSLDEDGHFLEVNQQWCTMLGFSREEVIGRWFGDFLSPENKEAFMRRFPLFKEQGKVQCEFEMLSKSGKPKYMAFEGKIGYGPRGEFVQTHCILQDITAQKAAETALVESESKYRSITENMSDVVWQMDLNLNTLYVSPSVEKLLGESPEENMRKKPEETFSAQTIRDIHVLLQEEFATGEHPDADITRAVTREFERRRDDGAPLWLEAKVSLMRDEQQRAIGLLGIARDITQRKLAELALADRERSVSMLLSNLQGMAYRCAYDNDWTMRFVSSGCLALTGYAPEDLIDNHRLSFNQMITPEYRDLLRKKWEDILPKRQAFRNEYELLTAAGERKWVLEIGHGIYGAGGEVVALEGIIIDITDRKEMEDKLQYYSERDDWTGLYNRRYLETILHNDLREAGRDNCALIGININTMHALSIMYGLPYSQRLLLRIADDLKLHISSECMLFHTHDYRFTFFLKGYENRAALERFCANVVSDLTGLLNPERISAGIGVVEVNRDIGHNSEQLLKTLLITTEEAAGAGDDTAHVVFYDRALEDRIARRERVHLELSRVAAGLHDDLLFLHYQPFLSLKDNKICGFEALARMSIEEYGMIPPLGFIPIAETHRLIVPIGYILIKKACGFFNKLKQLGRGDLSLAINISVIQLLSPGFVEHFLDILRHEGVDPAQFIVELTETVFSSRYDEIDRLISQLTRAGIHCAIDDFGTGYSSFSRERDLKIKYLKIDKSFVDRLMYLKDNETITSDIISMAHKLGHWVVAEGVEHPQQMEYLKKHGCDQVQGYFISKPLAEEDAVAFLIAHDTQESEGIA